MLRVIAGGIVLLSLGGCITSSYVGKWTAENMPDEETRSLTMEVNADGTFNGVAEADAPSRFAGTWRKDDSGKAIMVLHGGERPGTAELLGKERMVVDLDEGPPVQFKRLR